MVFWDGFKLEGLEQWKCAFQIEDLGFIPAEVETNEHSVLIPTNLSPCWTSTGASQPKMGNSPVTLENH